MLKRSNASKLGKQFEIIEEVFADDKQKWKRKRESKSQKTKQENLPVQGKQV